MIENYPTNGMHVFTFKWKPEMKIVELANSVDPVEAAH